METEGLEIYTVGHSTASLEGFLEVLGSHGIRALVDVRRYPVSRRYPHFGRDELARALAGVEIAYAWMPELGGRRKARPDSRNTAWRNDSFRGYADFMETRAFAAAIERLLEMARARRTAIMCAEAVWWRCHRGLIADYLKVGCGAEVVHIAAATRSEVHPLTSAARIVDGRLSYTDGGELLPFEAES